jgi:uncharacterized membrane protein YvlD (DUF360 family)
VTLLRRLIAFYRVQVELVWHWRPGRWQLLRRTVVSFAVAFVSLGATAALLPGLEISSPLALAAAVIVIGVLSAMVRPILLALVAPFSLVLVLVAALAFQVLVILLLGPLVPGVRLTGAIDAFIASWVFAAINSLVTWLLSLDSDDSYYAMLMRRLVSSRANVVRTTEPGLVIVQIDGLSHTVLSQQVRAGRVPNISRLVRGGTMRLAPWTTLLPSQTSASQAGIMFGTNDDIPAFRWWDKDGQRMFVSNRADDAERLERRLLGLSPGSGLLANDGASIGNLCSGGAARSYLTLSTIRDPSQGLGQSRAYFSFFLSPYAYVHAIVLGLAEAAKEVFQARRAQLAGIEPRLARHFPYPFLRALTNVVLRPLSTSLVIEEMLRGTPIIYVTYADYDEIAHYSGPQRAESLDALDGVDRAVGSLYRAAEDAPRPYRFVILSDHGQSLGATFRQRFGHSLSDVVRQLMGGADSVVAATQQLEHWRLVNSFLSEVSQAEGAAGALTRRALRRRMREGAIELDGGEGPRTTDAQPPKKDTPQIPEVAVCASGNLALVFFPRIDGRASLEQLDELYPGMVQALANHPGVGLLMVRSSADGPLAVSQSGVRHLDDGRVDGADPVAALGPYAERSLKRLDEMSNCGDLVLISVYDPDTGEVAAFEELIGSHGGLGGPQTDAMILHPAEWEVGPGPLIGAPAVYSQLRRWLDPAVAAGSAADASTATTVAAP